MSNSPVSDDREDIIMNETMSITSSSQYGSWGSTQGIAEVTVVAALISGSLIGAGVFLSEANDVSTPTELYAHTLTSDPSGTRFTGTFKPGAGFVTLGVNANTGSVLEYSIRAVRYL